MISLIEAASTYQLTTSDRVKLLLGIPASDTSKDILLNLFIDLVTDDIQGICERVFAREEVTESLQGSGRLRLILSRRPIVYVTEVRYLGTVVDPLSYSVESPEGGMLYSAGGWIEQRFSVGVSRTAVSPQIGEAGYEVDYIGGYWLPGFVGSPASGDVLLPKSLEGIAMEMVVSQYRQIGTDRDIQGYSIGDYSVQYRNNANPLIDQQRARLMRYTLL